MRKKSHPPLAYTPVTTSAGASHMSMMFTPVTDAWYIFICLENTRYVNTSPSCVRVTRRAKVCCAASHCTPAVLGCTVCTEYPCGVVAAPDCAPYVTNSPLLSLYAIIMTPGSDVPNAGRRVGTVGVTRSYTVTVRLLAT